MQRSALNAQAATGQGDEPESVVVHVQLRPRRGATRKCLAALAALAAEHDQVSFGVSGLSKDDRVVRVTVGVDLGPRAGVAKFSPQAQAAYAFVSAIFATLYDHMPVYTAEPSGAERAAAAVLLEQVDGGGIRPDGLAADVLTAFPVSPTSVPTVPSPRPAGPGEKVPA
jgi:hypothetical protein